MLSKIKILIALLFVYNISFGQVNTDEEFPNSDYTNIDLIADEAYFIAKAQGKYSVYFGCDPLSTRIIDKPIIYVEGINLEPVNVQKNNNQRKYDKI